MGNLADHLPHTLGRSALLYQVLVEPFAAVKGENDHDPSIIRESSEGFARIPLEDTLYQKREIYCIGEITKESVCALLM